MASHHRKNSHHRHSKSREWLRSHQSDHSSRAARPKFEIVIKCDSSGSVEAVASAVSGIVHPDVDISIIHHGVGSIHKSDILMAEAGSRLIIGFQVDVQPGLDALLREYGVEVRLHNVIYKLIADVRMLADSVIPHIPEESIIGSARVIALFKSSRKGIIIGCEILNGSLAVHQHFRIIAAMGPVYAGTIDSMHIENTAVQKAVKGQKVGIKIRGFNKVKIGDIVESYRPLPLKDARPWRPASEIIRIN